MLPVRLSICLSEHWLTLDGVCGGQHDTLYKVGLLAGRRIKLGLDVRDESNNCVGIKIKDASMNVFVACAHVLGQQLGQYQALLF